MTRSRRFRWVYIRRLSQVLFLAAFLYLFFRAEFGIQDASADAIHSWDSVTLFFRLDPLLTLSVILSEKVLPLLWWLALPVLLSALVFNRAFCGWACPFGTLHHLASAGRKSAARAVRTERWKWRPTRNVKFVFLFVLLSAMVLGFNLAGWADPFSFLNRSLAVVVHPVLGHGADLLIAGLDGIGLNGVGDFLNDLLRGRLIPFQARFFLQILPVGLLFAGALLLNRRETRFWCRHLCPLGAFLGLFSRQAPIRLHKDPEKCTRCMRCVRHCQGGDQPLPGEKWVPSECHLCGNCTDSCPEDALAFRFGRPRSAPEDRTPLPDLDRRLVLGGLAGGLILAPLSAAGAHLLEKQDRSYKLTDRLIRPPGALEEKSFQAVCIKCGACMKACPTNALQPASWQAGIGGLWTPILVPKIGYCDDRCTLCGQVCPTQAIRRLTVEKKLGLPPHPEPVRIGLAHVDRNRCLPWALGKPCLVCEEVCPSPGGRKAIKAVEEEAVTPGGTRVKVLKPVVDPTNCIGCGLCEHKCPVADSSAIVVTCVGESRSRYNRITH